MNRGAGRQQVFFTQSDGTDFERLLAEGSERFGVEVHAYCLMRNHYHLLLHCPEGQLSDFMHHVGAVFTRRSNARRGRDGPIFRARFRSIVVDSADYLLTASRYIHRNPLDIVPTPPLDRYRWSSLRTYAGLAARPSWLHTEHVVRMVSGGRAGYLAYVTGSDTDRLSDPLTIRSIIELLLDDAGDWPASQRAALVRYVAAAAEENCREHAASTFGTLLARSSDSAAVRTKQRALARVASSPELQAVVSAVLRLAA